VSVDFSYYAKTHKTFKSIKNYKLNVLLTKELICLARQAGTYISTWDTWGILIKLSDKVFFLPGQICDSLHHLKPSEDDAHFYRFGREPTWTLQGTINSLSLGIYSCFPFHFDSRLKNLIKYIFWNEVSSLDLKSFRDWHLNLARELKILQSIGYRHGHPKWSLETSFSVLLSVCRSKPVSCLGKKSFEDHLVIAESIRNHCPIIFSFLFEEKQ
jgi:hypothetical protein